MPLPCARCDMPLPKWELASGGTATCTMCQAENQVRVFPALFAERQPAARPETAAEGEAACFDHPSKRAVAACSQCGRFICQLCSVEFGADIWCPSCVAAGAGKAKAARLDTSINLFDSMALLLPFASLAIWPLTMVAAPASLVLTLVKWKQPLSLVRRNRWRFVAGGLVSLAMIGGWLWLLIYGIQRLRAQQ